jgi:hypothetical protein
MTPYNPLVAVLTHSGANETVARHWPYYLRSGADILMVGRVGTDCRWPTASTHQCPISGKFHRIYEMRSGIESYVNGDNHIVRLLDVIDTFCYKDYYRYHTHLCVIEYDGVFLQPIPLDALQADGSLVTYVNGYEKPGEKWHGSRFLHTPWLMDRNLAYKILKAGNAMLRAQLIEHGFVDRFLGLLCDLHDIPVHVSNTFSANALDTPAFMSAAQKCVASGGWYSHSCKTKEMLSELLTALPKS